MRISIFAILALSCATLTGCLAESRLVSSETRALDADGAAILELDMGAGDLDVVGEAGLESVHLDVSLRTHETVLAQDDAAMDGLEVTLERLGDRIVARVSLPERLSSYYADAVLRVPARLAVVGEDGSGDALISDVAALTLTDGSGDLEVRRVSGDVDIDDDSGDLRVADVGPLTVQDGSGDVALANVNGPLDLVDESGETSVVGVGGSVTLDMGSGGVRCLDVDGDVEVTDASGDLWFENVTGEVRVRDGSGGIEAVNVGGLDVIQDESGEVVLR